MASFNLPFLGLNVINADQMVAFGMEPWIFGTTFHVLRTPSNFPNVLRQFTGWRSPQQIYHRVPSKSGWESPAATPPVGNPRIIASGAPNHEYTHYSWLPSPILNPFLGPRSWSIIAPIRDSQPSLSALTFITHYYQHIIIWPSVSTIFITHVTVFININHYQYC